jgi:hypothetical protein
VVKKREFVTASGFLIIFILTPLLLWSMTQSPKNERQQNLLRNKSFLIETVYIIAIIIITILIFLDFVDTGFFLGPYRFSHWMGIIGSSFILVFAPLYYITKRRFPHRYKVLINLHIFGFTTAFLLVSIHLAGQLSRPLYILVAILVATGYLYRYNPIKLKSGKTLQPHTNRMLHVGLIGGLYVVLIGFEDLDAISYL